MPVSNEAPNGTQFLNSKGKVRPAPQLEGLIADTHAHLSMLANPPLALAQCAWHGVGFVLCMVDPAEDVHSYELLDEWLGYAQGILDDWVAAEPEHTVAGGVAPKLPHVRLALGVHPHNAKRFTPECERLLLRYAADPRTACVGEIGLDYHYDFSPRELQVRTFRRQLELADAMGLPVSLHLREAHTQALAVLRETGIPTAGCLVHCYNRDRELLAPFLDLGCDVAFGGPLTFKKSDDVRDSATTVPRIRLLTETDCPYMTPEPCRGTECTPSHTVFTARCLVDTYLAAHPEAGPGQAFLDTLYRNALALLDRGPTAWQTSPDAQAQLVKAATGTVTADESRKLCAQYLDDVD